MAPKPKEPYNSSQSSSNGLKRILFMGEAVSLAHVMRPWVLAKFLSDERYQPIFASDPRYRSLLDDDNVPFYPIKSLAAEKYLKHHTRRLPLFDSKSLNKQIHEDLKLIRKVRPDFIVGDHRLSLVASAPYMGVPFAQITNFHWSPYGNEPFIVPNHPLSRVFGETMGQFLFDMLNPITSARHTYPFNVARRRYALHSLGYSFKNIHTEGNFTFYADIPNLFKSMNLPVNHMFLGPITWSANVPLPTWWDDLPSDRPLIYVNLGSTGTPELLNNILKTLSQLPVTIVVATGGRYHPTTLPPKVYLSDYLPGEKCLKKAAVAIINGGSEPFYHALSKGVPMLAIASTIDQHMMMQAAQREGVGIKMRAEAIKPRKLLAAVSSLIQNPTHRFVTRRISRLIIKNAAEVRFHRFLDEFFGFSTPIGPVPYGRRLGEFVREP